MKTSNLVLALLGLLAMDAAALKVYNNQQSAILSQQNSYVLGQNGEENRDVKTDGDDDFFGEKEVSDVSDDDFQVDAQFGNYLVEEDDIPDIMNSLNNDGDDESEGEQEVDPVSEDSDFSECSDDSWGSDDDDEFDIRA